jgi:hypothetical protein
MGCHEERKEENFNSENNICKDPKTDIFFPVPPAPESIPGPPASWFLPLNF